MNAHINALEKFTPAKDLEKYGAMERASDHGTSGPIEVSYSTTWGPEPVIPAFLTSLASLGIPTNDHAVGGTRERSTFFLVTFLLSYSRTGIHLEHGKHHVLSNMTTELAPMQ